MTFTTFFKGPLVSASLTALLAVASLSALPALAQDAMPLPTDATEVEQAAYAVLDKHCARCHQDGALKEGLTKSKSGFGHVMDIRRLAQDTKFVVQGNAAGSQLYNVIGEYSFPAMPDDCTESACFPTDAEMAAVSTWIEGLTAAAPPPRPVISLSEMHQLALADLQAQPANRHDRIRYFSLRSVHNNPEVSPENLEGYRAATVKLMNALSWNPMPYQLETVDENGTLFRVFLPELDWDIDTWHLLESHYPYGTQSDVDTALGQLTHLTGTQVPIIRADWFTATASVSPLYYDMLRLPDTVAGLESLLGINTARNIRNEQVVRAGFQNSGVSTHNRLIERHAMGTGFFWTSYDFAGSRGRQSFFEYPLGPKEVFGEELAFEHDGGESIFTLPNGFHAYYLNTEKGVRLDVGPTQIVRDDDYTDGTGEVVNGISCISCHNKGIRLNEDKVRDVALGDFTLSPSERQTIDAIYPGQDEVAKWLQKDTVDFFAALESAGIPADTTAGGLEPVRGLFVYYIDRFVNFAQAAHELGLTEDELRARMGFVGADLASMMLRLDQSPIARDEWTAAYPAILERVTEYRSILPRHHKAADLSYSVKKAITAAGHTPPPVKAAADSGYVPSDHSVPTKGHLTVYTDKPAYKVGEGLRIFVEPRDDCRLTLINIDSHKRSCVLYPHPALPDAPIPAGTQYVFPPRGSLKTSTPGTETILAICNGSDQAIGQETRDTSRVSCDVSQRKPGTGDVRYDDVVREVLALDLGDDSQTTGAGVTYRAISSHNPNVAKAQVTAIVTAH